MIIMMKKANVYVPVLLIFFCRPECFRKVFEQVKLARPSKLFLYQDGARPNNINDIENVKKCREIAEDIDWDCEVHRFYQDENVGCDPSEFIAIKWMFQNVDRGIILEDDDVPSQSFFIYCTQLLEKYKDDKRINKILGQNHMGIYKEIDSDYFFTNVSAIWGWATWKRCTDLWQEHLDFLYDEALVDKVRDTYSEKRIFISFLETCKRHSKSGKAYYESINEAAQRLNNQINIAPKKNMITNIGLTEDATHNNSGSLKMIPRAVRTVFEANRYELNFPLKHPKEVKPDYAFENFVHKIIYPNKVRAIMRTYESRFLRLFCTGSEGRRSLKDNIKRKILKGVKK
jgi:hypothetical protein